MMNDFIPFALPDIDDQDIAAVVETLKSNWLTAGPKAKLFEQNFENYLGIRHALAVNSATSGLHLALTVAGVGPGDKVITTPYTFAATAGTILQLNADPVFIDVREESLNINPEEIRRFCYEECVVRDNILYHKKTNTVVKAILPVHVAGKSCEMIDIMKIAKEFHLRVIEDAAHALPSYDCGKKIGSSSDIAVFSFYATKPMTTGEGGMVVTSHANDYERMKLLRLHGITRDAWQRETSQSSQWYYEVVEPGFKYNMSDISASLGIQQLKKIDHFHKKRKELASLYHQELSEIDEIEIPSRELNDHAWHLYIIKLNSKRCSRDNFIKKLSQKGIATSVHFIPLHLQPFYKKKYGFRPDDFPIAYQCFQKAVSLPIYTKLKKEDILRVARSIKEVLQ